MGQFDGITPCMRIEILIDPDTGDFQTDVHGNVEDIKSALRAVLLQLENPDIVEDLSSEGGSFRI